jgi:hypothetical protein
MRERTEAKSLEASNAIPSENHVTGRYLPIAKQRAAPGVNNFTPEPELMPADQEPPANAHVSYVDLDGPNEPLRPPPAPSVPQVNPLRHSSMNVPNATPSPPAPIPPSRTTTSYFSDVPAAGGLGPLRRGADWMPKGNL